MLLCYAQGLSVIGGLVIAQVLKRRSDCLPLKAIKSNGRSREGSDQSVVTKKIV